MVDPDFSSRPGWSETAFVLGIIVLLVAFPITRLLRNRPEDYGLLPDGDTQEEVAYSDTPDGKECVEIHSVHWNKSVEQRVNVYFKTILKRMVANGYDH